MPVKNKFLQNLKALYVARTKPAGGLVTTLTNAAAAGAGTITVNSNVNAADQDAIRIGSGETAELNQINGAITGVGPYVITLKTPLQKAHAVGEDTVEVTVYDLGAPEKGGVDLIGSEQITDVMVANQRLPITNIKGYIALEADFTLPFLTTHTFALSIGIPLTLISGAGTVASPKQLITDGNEFGTDNDLCIIAIGTLVDGTVVAVELWGCNMDYTQGQVQLQRGSPASVNCKAKSSSGGVVTTVLPTYPIDVSLRAQKQQVWQAPTEFGILADQGGGIVTALTAIAAVGDAALVVAASAGAAAGDIVRVGVGSDAEYPAILAVVDGTHVTLRTKLLHAHPIGEVVVEQTRTVFASVTEQGATLSTGGSVRTISLADRAIEAGIIPDDASITFATQLGELSLANFARAFGIPASAIVGNRLPLDSQIGSSDIAAFYVKGLLQGGDTLEIGFWGLAQVLSSITTKFGNGQVATIPISGKPAILQVLQYQ